METSSEPKQSLQGQSFVSMMSKGLGIAEKVTIALAIAIQLMKRIGYDTGGAMLIILSVLAAVYFLNGYMPARKTAEVSEKPGFSDLLYLTIVPKVGWISCSVAIVGISFRLMHLPGGREMMLIGFATTAVAIFIIGIGLLQENERARGLIALVTRLIPLSAISGYFLFVN